MDRVTEPTIANDASKGLVTARDPSTLGPGEMTVAESCEYRVGSPHNYKLPGRSSTDSTLGNAVLAVNKLQYDSASDVLVADANGIIWESTADLTPSFASSGVTDLSTTAIPQYTGFKNEWIRCNGVDDNMIREPAAVPNGTQGNWRTVGMGVAQQPTLNLITHYTGGGQTVRPTTAVNGPYQPQAGNGGYYDTALAFDGPGIGTGTVSGAAGQTVLTGAGTLFTTQLSIGAVLTFSDGQTNSVLTITSATTLGLATNLTTALSGATFTYVNSSTSTDPLTTKAYGLTGDVDHVITGTSTPIIPRTITCTWQFTTNLSGTGRILTVRHNGNCSPPDQGPNFGPTGMTFHLEYSIDSGGSWSDLGPVRHQPFPSILEDGVPIPDGLNMSTLWVRSTIISTAFQQISGHWLDVVHAIYDIRVSTGTSGVYNAANSIFYGVSESYTDSDGVEHQGNMGTTLEIYPDDLQAATSVLLNLPSQINPLATQFIIWRSLDTPGGGFPVMFAIGHTEITDDTWTDTLIVRPDDTAANALLEQYKVLEILYVDGNSSFASFYSQPPLSFMTLVFQGSLCYFPAGAVNARRIYYSLPSSLSVTALEQVPEQYYLDFQTPRNDQVKSGAITNGGRSMLAFFENYTMLVNYLPQGADPGGFNNTVKEYVSNVRGCSGAMACTEFTLPSGQTLVASVDGLGLWITNGVNLVEEWSTDLDWATAFDGVDLTGIQLFDKPHKRRIELLFVAADGTRQEYHFFYGRMKQGIDGKQLPLITGPHISGTRCRHYTVIDGNWEGYSGDSSTTGDVFIEDSQAADDSHGYDATGIVPWNIEMGDVYVGGIHKSHIVEDGSYKFSDSPEKEFALTCTFIRDAGATTVLNKTLAVDQPQMIYFHMYCDRHRAGFSDLTNTAAPAFISYVITTRTAGPARDR